MRAISLLTAAVATAALLATPACGKSPRATAATNTPTLPAAQFDGISISELSGLAWDADEQLLYAVSDQGYVFHFRLKLAGDAIAAVEPVYAAALTDPKAGATGKDFNAEGLTAVNADNGKIGDTELVVSLEGKQPGILRFNPAGTKLGELPVPPPADDVNNYRKKGRGLESVALHPAHGLMTGPESPLLGQPDDRHTLYANDRQWSFVRHSPDSRLKAFNVLPDGNLLVLERSQAGSKESLTASLRRVDLAACPQNGGCETRTLAVLPPGPDNFEGMTLLDPHRVLLVSDNGGNTAHGTRFLLIVLP